MSIHPALALLVGIRAADGVHFHVAAGRGARGAGAGRSANRLARHCSTLATTAPPGKEVRVTRIGDDWSDSGARRGSAGIGRWRRRAGTARCGTR